MRNTPKHSQIRASVHSATEVRLCHHDEPHFNHDHDKTTHQQQQREKRQQQKREKRKDQRSMLRVQLRRDSKECTVVAQQREIRVDGRRMVVQISNILVRLSHCSLSSCFISSLLLFGWIHVTCAADVCLVTHPCAECSTLATHEQLW